jgi:uncharacterized membrane protein
MTNPKTNRMVWVTMLLLSVIGVWSALSHYLPQPDAEFVQAFNPPPGKEWFLEQMPLYDARPVMTALHVIPAFLFMLMVPLQLARRIRQKNIAIHRWTGRTFVALSIIMGIVGIAIGIIMPFGGADEVVASSLIGAGFLCAMTMGVIRIRQKQIAAHREWMLRMLAFGFTPVTMRGLMLSGVLLFDLHAPAIFGWSMLVGVLVNVIIVESWIRHTRPGQQRTATPGTVAATTA